MGFPASLLTESVYGSFIREMSAEGKSRMSNFGSYENEQSAMIAWLQQRSPDVWHAVAGYLNWDSAEDVIEWIISQPQCDLATAALLFWKGAPDYWLQFPNVEAVCDFQVHGFNFCKNLAGRANSGFYTRRELEFFTRDETCLIGGVDYFLKSEAENLQRCFQKESTGPFPWEFPTSLMPPIPGRPAIVSQEENPKTGTEIQGLLAELGTYISESPVLSKPQQFQIGEHVTKISYPVNNIYQGVGTILKVNDSDYKFLYLVQLDNGVEVVLTENRMEKIDQPKIN
jgi:hypothetical protein